jgi:NADH-quinone oxidoreductase E subunit
VISDDVRARMRALASRYPSARSATLPALHLAQEAEGYVTPAGVEAVAEALGLRVDEVDSVVSFYSMFFKRPVGRAVIKVCTSISCYLRGSDALLAHMERTLGIRRGETTADGAVTLLPTECLAACGGACALQVNDEIVERVTHEGADALLAGLRTPSPGAASARPAAKRHGAEAEA